MKPPWKEGDSTRMFTPMETRLVAVLALLSCVSPAAAQRAASSPPPPPPPGWSAFVRTFDAFAAGDSVVGGSVLVLRDGRVLAHHEYGFADRALGQRVDERTIFHWASITKTLTAVAVMQLRDRGRPSLDDRVTRYLPELAQVHDSFGAIGDITLRMLLSHSAGFQDPTWPYKAGKPWEPFEPARWEQLVAMMPYQEILFRPGTRYGYSNPAFIYLARIIEQLSGDPYQSYIYKNIWTPLGMTRSYFGATPYHLAAARANDYTLLRDSAGRVSLVAHGRDFDPGITIPNGGWNAPPATWPAGSRSSRVPRAATPCWRAPRSPRCGARCSPRGTARPRGTRSASRSSCCGMAARGSSGTRGTRRGSGRSSISIPGPPQP